MKKACVICRLLCVLLILLMLPVPASASQPEQSAGISATAAATEEETSIVPDSNDDKPYDASVYKGCHSLDARFSFLGNEKRLDNAAAAVLYDFTNDTLMYSINPDTQLKPASLVKIMTGMLIAQADDLSVEVTIPENYVFSLSDGQRTTGLQPGETIRLEDLLYCVLVGSSNDAAVIAAEHLYGSQSAFVDEMNRQAQQLGCSNTSFSDVTGLSEDNQHSTARDLARILSAAMKIDAFRTPFCTTHYTVPATNLSEARRLVSNNFLTNTEVMSRYYDKRVLGGRIGITSDGGRNIAAISQRNEIEMITIVLGSASTYTESGQPVDFGGFQETITLLNWGYRGLAKVQILYENQALMQYEVINGECDVILCPNKSVFVTLPGNIVYDDLSFRFSSEYEGIAAPIEKGTRVSAVEVWYNGLCISQVDLYAMNRVRIQEPVDLTPNEVPTPAGLSPLLIVMIIIAVLLVLLFGRRLIYRVIRRHQIRRYRKNRRRSR